MLPAQVAMVDEISCPTGSTILNKVFTCGSDACAGYGAAHRSPYVMNGQRRLLLTIDEADCSGCMCCKTA